jgi:hypothetical protein
VGHHLAGVPDQKTKNLILAARQLHPPPAHQDDTAH